MKSFYVLTFCLITFSITYSQDITATLADSTSGVGFSIVSSQGDTLFRVTGEGNVGIGNSTPTGLLDTRKTISSGQGKSIFLQGESTSDWSDDSTGDAIIAGGDNILTYSTGGKITLLGCRSNIGGDVTIQGGIGAGGAGGDVKIQGANSQYISGSVDIIAGSGMMSGSINLITKGYSNFGGGDINLTTGEGGTNSGSITLKTCSPSNLGVPGEINLIGGNSQEYWSNINIKAGDNIGGYSQGGDIKLTPGTGSPDGLVKVNGSGTYSGTWTQASDERYKKNIKPLVNSLDLIAQMNTVSYEWKKEEYPSKNFSDGNQIGLIAQDVEKIVPELVSTDGEGYKSIDYAKINVLLINAIQEQQKIINNQNEKIVEIQSTLNSLLNNDEVSNSN